MISFLRGCGTYTAGALTLLSLTGCHTFKQPDATDPHAVVTVTYLGGEVNPQTGYVAFGYRPGVNVCKGKKAGLDCKKSVAGQIGQDRKLTFRIPAGQELTITPLGLVSSSYKNDGVTATTTKAFCLGEAYTVTAQAGDKLDYYYAYDAEQKACGSKRADELPPEGEPSPEGELSPEGE